LRSWAPDLDDATRAQAERTARLPVVTGHVSLMADAHLGLGATVGSVVPTEGAIIPSCVGVDIGCGLAAVRTDLRADDLPESLDPLLSGVESAIPAGVGRGHDRRSSKGSRKGQHRSPAARRRTGRAEAWLAEHEPRTVLDDRRRRTA